MSAGRSEQVSTVVLLEGPSDVAAVRAVAAVYGVTARVHRFQLIDMGGVTNVRRHLEALPKASPGVRVIGMCDAGEAQFFVRALQQDGGNRLHDAGALAEHGFQVCDADLEDELIRALGTDRVVSVLRRLGLLRQLATFRNQPAWRGRALHEQLHRFAGVASGRKTLLAGALARDLSVDEVPEPLRRLVEAMAGSPLPMCR